MIKPRAVAFRLFLSLVTLVVPAPVRASDVQVWSELDLTKPFGDRVSVLVPVLVRNSAELENPQLFATGATVDLDVGRHLTLTGGYLFGDLPQVGTGLHAHLPLVAATARFKIRRVTIADRNRVEKLFGIPGNPIRYRNRLGLDLKLPGAFEQWHVFLIDEALYGAAAGIWNENRFQAGAGRKVNSRAFLDVYYLLRNMKQLSPSETHVIGLILHLQLTGDH